MGKGGINDELTPAQERARRLVREAALRHKLNPDFLEAVAFHESGLRNEATSPKGAAGIAQFMEGTAKRYGLSAEDRRDPVKASDAMARHFKDLLKKYDGDPELALIGYNAGEGRADKVVAARRSGQDGGLAQETADYIPAIRKQYDAIRSISAPKERDPFRDPNVKVGPDRSVRPLPPEGAAPAAPAPPRDRSTMSTAERNQADAVAYAEKYQADAARARRQAEARRRAATRRPAQPAGPQLTPEMRAAGAFGKKFVGLFDPRGRKGYGWQPAMPDRPRPAAPEAPRPRPIDPNAGGAPVNPYAGAAVPGLYDPPVVSETGPTPAPDPGPSVGSQILDYVPGARAAYSYFTEPEQAPPARPSGPPARQAGPGSVFARQADGLATGAPEPAPTSLPRARGYLGTSAANPLGVNAPTFAPRPRSFAPEAPAAGPRSVVEVPRTKAAPVRPKRLLPALPGDVIADDATMEARKTDAQRAREARDDYIFRTFDYGSQAEEWAARRGQLPEGSITGPPENYFGNPNANETWAEYAKRMVQDGPTNVPINIARDAFSPAIDEQTRLANQERIDEAWNKSGLGQFSHTFNRVVNPVQAAGVAVGDDLRRQFKSPLVQRGMDELGITGTAGENIIRGLANAPGAMASGMSGYYVRPDEKRIEPNKDAPLPGAVDLIERASGMAGTAPLTVAAMSLASPLVAAAGLAPGSLLGEMGVGALGLGGQELLQDQPFDVPYRETIGERFRRAGQGALMGGTFPVVNRALSPLVDPFVKAGETAIAGSRLAPVLEPLALPSRAGSAASMFATGYPVAAMTGQPMPGVGEGLENAILGAISGPEFNRYTGGGHGGTMPYVEAPTTVEYRPPVPVPEGTRPVHFVSPDGRVGVYEAPTREGQTGRWVNVSSHEGILDASQGAPETVNLRDDAQFDQLFPQQRNAQTAAIREKTRQLIEAHRADRVNTGVEQQAAITRLQRPRPATTADQQARAGVDEALSPDVEQASRPILPDATAETAPAPSDAPQIYTGPERRERPRLFSREETAAMSKEELEEAYHDEALAGRLHELTGIPNRVAYEDKRNAGTLKPVQVSIDVRGLKQGNDTIHPSFGDNMLDVTARILMEEAPDSAYHLKGDEFVAGAETEAEAAELMARVQARLDGAILRHVDPETGEPFYFKGVEVLHGTGPALEVADAALNRAKKLGKVDDTGRATTRGLVEVDSSGRPGGRFAARRPGVRRSGESATGRVGDAVVEPEALPTKKAGGIDWDRVEAEARASLAERYGAVRSGFDVGMVGDLAKIVAAKIARQGIRSTEWVADFIREFGDSIRPELASIKAKALDILDRESRALDGGDRPRARTAADVRPAAEGEYDPAALATFNREDVTRTSAKVEDNAKTKTGGKPAASEVAADNKRSVTERAADLIREHKSDWTETVAKEHPGEKDLNKVFDDAVDAIRKKANNPETFERLDLDRIESLRPNKGVLPDGAQVVRPRGQNASNRVPETWTKPDHAYRGMEQAEFDATVGAGKGVKSRGDYSFAAEGTVFAVDAETSESYVNTGRSDPRKTGKPTYIVEVAGRDGFTLSPSEGYLKTPDAIDQGRITRIWKMEGRDGAIVAKLLDPATLGKPAKARTARAPESNVFFEIAPSKSVAQTEAWHKQDFKARQESTRKIFDATFPDILKVVGLDPATVKIEHTIGGFQLETNPSVRLGMRATDAQVDAIVRVLGDVFRQDSVLVARLGEDAGPNADTDFVRVEFPKGHLTPENADAFFQHAATVHESLGGGFAAKDDAIVFMNIRGEDGPYSEKSPDEFYDLVRQAAESYDGADAVEVGRPDELADVRFAENDWKEQPNGEGYRSALEEGRPEIGRDLDRIRAKVDAEHDSIAKGQEGKRGEDAEPARKPAKDEVVPDPEETAAITAIRRRRGLPDPDAKPHDDKLRKISGTPDATAAMLRSAEEYLTKRGDAAKERLQKQVTALAKGEISGAAAGAPLSLPDLVDWAASRIAAGVVKSAALAREMYHTYGAGARRAIDPEELFRQAKVRYAENVRKEMTAPARERAEADRALPDRVPEGAAAMHLLDNPIPVPRTNGQFANIDVTGQFLNEYTVATVGRIEPMSDLDRARQQFHATVMPEVIAAIKALVGEGGNLSPAARKKLRDSLEWYRHAIDRTMRVSREVFPTLADPAHDMLFKLLLGPTSPQSNPQINYSKAADVYKGWLNSGTTDLTRRFPKKRPNGKSWGLLAAEHAFARMDALVQHFGSLEGAVNWLVSDVPIGTPSNPAPGSFRWQKDVQPGDVGAPGKDLPGTPKGSRFDYGVPGALIFGPKAGRFALNILQFAKQVTIDLWAARTVNRTQGTLMDWVTLDASETKTWKDKYAKIEGPEGLQWRESETVPGHYEKLVPSKGTKWTPLTAAEQAAMHKTLRSKKVAEDGTPVRESVGKEGVDWRRTNVGPRQYGPPSYETQQPTHWKWERMSSAEETALVAKMDAIRGERDVNWREHPTEKGRVQTWSVADQPRSEPERQFMIKLFTEGAQKVTDLVGFEVAPMDFQALVWFAEQGLWRAHGARNESWSFDQAAVDYARRNGIEPDTTDIAPRRDDDEAGPDGEVGDVEEVGEGGGQRSLGQGDDAGTGRVPGVAEEVTPAAGDGLRETAAGMRASGEAESAEAVASMKARSKDRAGKAGRTTSAGIDPTSIAEDIADLVTLGKGHVKRGAATLVDWSADFLDALDRHFGADYAEKVKPFLEDIYNRATGKAPAEPIADPTEAPDPTAAVALPANWKQKRGRLAIALKKNGANGDRLANALDLADELAGRGGQVSQSGMVRLYHRTTPEAARSIVETGEMSGKEDQIYFSTKPDGAISEYGKALVEVDVPLASLNLEDVFDGEAHVTLRTGAAGKTVKVRTKPENPEAVAYEASKAEIVKRRREQYATDKAARQSTPEGDRLITILPDMTPQQKLAAIETNATARVKAKLKAMRSTTNAGLDPTLFADMAIAATAKFTRKVLSYEEFARAMVKEFGEAAKTHHLSRVYEVALAEVKRNTWRDESDAALRARLAAGEVENDERIRALVNRPPGPPKPSVTIRNEGREAQYPLVTHGKTRSDATRVDLDERLARVVNLAVGDDPGVKGTALPIPSVKGYVIPRLKDLAPRSGIKGDERQIRTIIKGLEEAVARFERGEGPNTVLFGNREYFETGADKLSYKDMMDEEIFHSKQAFHTWQQNHGEAVGKEANRLYDEDALGANPVIGVADEKTTRKHAGDPLGPIEREVAASFAADIVAANPSITQAEFTKRFGAEYGKRTAAMRIAGELYAEATGKRPAAPPASDQRRLRPANPEKDIPLDTVARVRRAIDQHWKKTLQPVAQAAQKALTEAPDSPATAELHAEWMKELDTSDLLAEREAQLEIEEYEAKRRARYEKREEGWAKEAAALEADIKRLNRDGSVKAKVEAAEKTKRVEKLKAKLPQEIRPGSDVPELRYGRPPDDRTPGEVARVVVLGGPRATENGPITFNVYGDRSLDGTKAEWHLVSPDGHTLHPTKEAAQAEAQRQASSLGKELVPSKGTPQERLKAFEDRKLKDVKTKLRLIAKGETQNALLPVDVIADLIAVGAAKIARHGYDFIEFSRSMIKEFGESVGPDMREIYDGARRKQKELEGLGVYEREPEHDFRPDAEVHWNPRTSGLPDEYVSEFSRRIMENRPPEGYPAETREPLAVIEEAARLIGPELVAHLGTWKKGEAIPPVRVVLQAKNYAESLSRQADDMFQRADVGVDADGDPLTTADRDAMLARAEELERASIQVIQSVIPIKTEIGRALSALRIKVNSGMSAARGIQMARRLAQRSGHDVNSKSWTLQEAKIGEIAGADGRATERVAALEAALRAAGVDPGRLVNPDGTAVTSAEALKVMRDQFGAKVTQKAAKTVKPFGEELIERAKKRQADGWAELKKLRADLAGGKLSSGTGVPAEFIEPIVKIVSGWLTEKAITRAEIAKRLIDEFGEEIKPQIDRIRARAFRMNSDDRRSLRRERDVENLTGGEPEKYSADEIEDMLADLDQERAADRARVRDLHRVTPDDADPRTHANKIGEIPVGPSGAGHKARSARGTYQSRLEAQALDASSRLLDSEWVASEEGLDDIAKVGAAKLVEEGMTRERWNKEMVEAFGDAYTSRRADVFAATSHYFTEARDLDSTRRTERAATAGKPNLTPEETAKAVREFLDAKKTQQKARIDLFKALQAVQKQTIVDMALLVRKAGLLTGVKTTLRNVVGTAGFAIVQEEIARIPSAIVDASIGAFTGQRSVTGPSAAAVGRALHEMATKGAREFLEVMKNGATKEQLDRLEISRELQSKSKILNLYTNGVFRFMSAQDRMMKVYVIRRALEGAAKVQAINERKQGVKTYKPDGTVMSVKERQANLVAEPPENLMADAILEADYATFNSENVIANAYSSARSSMRSGGFVGKTAAATADVLMPFVRTPTNILARILDYTPVGFGVDLGKMAYDIHQERGAGIEDPFWTQARQQDFARGLGRASLGTAIIAIGWQLAKLGLLSGTSDDDPSKRERDRTTGRQPMAIKIGGDWHSIGAFSPFGNLLTMGATMQREAVQIRRDPSVWLERTVGAAARTVIEQPMLKGSKDIIDAASRPATSGSKLSGGIAGSIIPTFVSDISDVMDWTERDKRGVIPSVAGRTPFRTMLPEAFDGLGRPVEHRRLNAVNPLLSKTARGDSDPVDKALQDLDVGLSRPKPWVGETNEQLRERDLAIGRLRYSRAMVTVTAPWFKNLDEDKRRDALENLLQAAATEVNDRLKGQRGIKPDP